MSKQVGIGVNTSEGKVYVAFDRSVDHIGLTPEQAVELAYTIYEKAQELKPKSSTLLLPQRLN